MILPDVNVLVYAFHRGAAEHDRYAAWLTEAMNTSVLALAEPALTGFVRIVTNPRIVVNAAPTPAALDFLDRVRGAPRARVIAPTVSTWTRMREIAERDPQVRGKLVPDAWLASLALSHGCRLATADRGFARFEGLDWFVPV